MSPLISRGDSFEILPHDAGTERTTTVLSTYVCWRLYNKLVVIYSLFRKYAAIQTEVIKRQNVKFSFAIKPLFQFFEPNIVTKF